ncbi:MAG: hypothetical protein JWP45_451 [Mucilaginibacter sp.]|nr:hypothetical protein [Mucilaginibacter sp.]
MNLDRSKFKPTSQLYFYKERFNDEITYFQRYVIEVAGQFEANALEINRNYQPGDDLDDAFEEAYKIQQLEFPKILNSSVLISIQTILEKTLKSLFTSGVRLFALRPRDKRSNESEIGYYKAVFETDFAFDFTAVGTAWRKIDDYRKVRNIFVHQGGNLKQLEPAKRQRMEAFIALDDRLVYNPHTGDIIIFDNQYLISYLNQVQVFCNALYDQLIKKHTQYIKSH